jgi:hypothetical protein
MGTFLIVVALIGGAVGLLGVLFSPSLAMLGIIGLACLAGILARIGQAGEHREAMDKRLNALFKVLEGRR